MVIFDAHAAGTPSALWESDLRLSEGRLLEVDDLQELIVIAAHPDDETLGAGGLIALAAERKVPIRLVVVTDGSGSHPLSPSLSPGELSDRRVSEVYAAVAILAPEAVTTLLNFPDGRAAEFASEISDALQSILRGAGVGTYVVVVWSRDGHSDHDTVGQIVERIAPVGATVLGYPIWTWHWGHPDSGALPWDQVRVLPLPRRVQERKARATSAYVSQVKPLSRAPGDERVLDPAVLEHFARDREVFLDVRAEGVS